MTSIPRPRAAGAALAALPVLALATAHAQPAASGADILDVVGTTPLGAVLDTRRIAANVQAATAAQIRDQGALDLSDFMKRSMGGVFVNEAQGNPLQPDVQYRGFVGSPLLGLPQGLAVYQDGVRLNEPFGDTVSWALIPESAIDTVVLMPGSNPLFGLNALGGAISIRTKTGFDHPGSRAEALAGSWGRTSLQAETGGSFADDWSYFVTGSLFDEDGWRDFSPSHAKQGFANVGTRNDRQMFDVSFGFADTDLVGNGPAPEDLLEIDDTAIFTRPDRTEARLSMLNLRGTQKISDAISLAGNLYRRANETHTLNGDDSELEECIGAQGFLCEQDGDDEELVLDAAGSPIAADDDLEGATINRTSTDQHSVGFGVEATLLGQLGGRDNTFAMGVVYDESDVHFTASTELGSLDATRAAVPGGVLVGEALVGLDVTQRTTGFYLTDSLSLGDDVALTLSGRYNRTTVSLEDQLEDDLTGDHEFERFNPAIGLTWDVSDAAQVYVGYSESNRVPSPVELTCADEDDPCRLPNAFLSDPPLEQVIAKTFEAGVRGTLRSGRWHAGLFHTVNEDDILFISAGELTNQGFFDNVGETLRFGLELGVAAKAGERTSWFVDYTTLDATFREHFVVASPNNPAADDGEIEVEDGDKLPLVPDSLLKAGVSFAVTAKLSLGVDAIVSAGAPFRGDEGNLIAELDGYSLVSFRAEYRLSPHARLFATVDNVLGEEYATFGVFGEADEVLGDDFEDPRFVGPGAPRAAWIGVRVEF